MSYTNAPATALVATHCAVCNRELLDAVSVEAGIGPVCREKHGYNIEANEDDRAEANQLVHAIAANIKAPTVGDNLDRLNALGFTRLARAIAKRVATVLVDIDDGVIALTAPYNAPAVDAMRGIPGRRWDGANKRNTFPVSSKVQLWQVLRAYYNGHVGFGPKGTFRITRLTLTKAA